MEKTLFMIHSDRREAHIHASHLEVYGWQVEIETQDMDRAIDRISKSQPGAIIINLNDDISEGIEVAGLIKRKRDIKKIPMVFVGEEFRELINIPKAFFTNKMDLPKQISQVV